MKSRLITLFFVAATIIFGASAKDYERVITFYKGAELIDEYKISELDSIKFETEYSGISTEGYYRIKNVETGLYLNAENYDFHYTGTRGGVTCVAYAEDADQIFKFEESGENYKLKTNSGYYIYCQQWIVDAQTNGVELALDDNGNGTYDIKFGSNYFGVSQDKGIYYPYCTQYNNRATWVLEEATQMPTYTISASATNGGTATASASSMAKGGSVTLIATPSSSYRFVNWTVNGTEVSTENIFIATITANALYVANFEERTSDSGISLTKEYRIKDVASGMYLNAENNITHVGGPNGGVNCVAYAEDDRQIFTFEASGNNYYLKSKSGYYIYCQQWNVDALTYGTVLTFIDNPDGTYFIKNGANYFKVELVNGVYYPFGDAGADLRATWVLEAIGGEEPEPTPTYTVSVSSTAGGTATASAESVEEGGSVILTATEDINYNFKNWTLNGEVVSVSNPYIATITENSEFVANFERYVVVWRNASSDLPGQGTFTVILNSTNEALKSSSKVPAGSELTLTATPSGSTNIFKYWKITTFIGATTEETVTITDNPATITVTDNTNISPVFDLVRYKMIVKTNGGGTAVASMAEAKPNEEVVFTATPADGYAFLNWTVNGEEVSTEFSYSAYYRTEDFEITANFIEYKKTGTLKNHDYVDLGLPSGTKWSTHCVGATLPEEVGEFFAWAETVPKATYTSENYKYEKTEWDSYNGVYWYYDYGKDERTELESLDDAARVSWGEGWRMPTKEEMEELCNPDNCIWTGTFINEVYVYKVTSKVNGNYIFIACPEGTTKNGEDGRYLNAFWSRRVKMNDSGGVAYCMYSAGIVSWQYRTKGLQVRAVCTEGKDEEVKVNYTISVSATEGGTATASAESVEEGGSVTITAVPNEGYEFDKWVINDIYMLTDLVCTIRVEEDLEIVARFVETANRHNGFEYVDLGLPSGTKWATCNVGAEESDELGGYVAWGETSSKDSYTAENYTYVNNPATLPLSADVANIYMGGNWRMPTEEEVQELIDYCTWSQTVSVSNLGASGHHITSNINGAKIFIPATGYSQGSMLQPKQYITQIWTSSIDSEDNQYAKSMYVKGTGTRKVQSSLRYKGLPIRAVFIED